MTNAETILAAFGAEEELTNAQICERTGFNLCTVATYTARMREDGRIEYVDGRHRPVVHRLAGAAKARAQMVAEGLAKLPAERAETLVGHACRTQARTVFELGRFA